MTLTVREGQAERAKKLVGDGYTSSARKRIDTEEKYDGFYAVCTNLDESLSSIAKGNKHRWEIVL